MTEAMAARGPQRFGGSLNPHFHFHLLAVDGGLSEHGPSGEIRFHEATRLEPGHWLEEDAATDMLTWQASGGFRVDASVRAEGHDRAAVERLVRSRSVLEAAVAEAGFVLEVERIVDVEEEVEIRTWKVETRQGRRTFRTKLDDWPVAVPGGGIVIRDVAGDLYHVRDPRGMDAASRKWLWAFVD